MILLHSDCLSASAMLKTCILLLYAASVVKTLTVPGPVGGNVTFKCSGWAVTYDLKSYEKYLCKSPCLTDKDVIAHASPGKSSSGNNGTVLIRNDPDGLSVTFTRLQISDFKTYVCALDTYWVDPLVKVNLIVGDAGPYHSATTAQTVVPTHASVRIGVSISPTASSSAPQRAAEPSAYLVTGVVTMIIVVMAHHQPVYAKL